jgi:hypothetical protein
VAHIPKLRRRSMRSRHQEGWVEERGNRLRRSYGHYYVYTVDEAGKEKRCHVGVSLGEKSKLRKWEAEQEGHRERYRLSAAQGWRCKPLNGLPVNGSFPFVKAIGDQQPRGVICTISSAIFFQRWALCR